MSHEQDHDDWAVIGEVPDLDPESFKKHALRAFLKRALTMGGGVPQGHEVSTMVEDEHMSVISDPNSRIREAAIAGTAIAGLAVFGILAARHHMRVNKKK